MKPPKLLCRARLRLEMWSVTCAFNGAPLVKELGFTMDAVGVAKAEGGGSAATGRGTGVDGAIIELGVGVDAGAGAGVGAGGGFLENTLEVLPDF